ncbi:Tubulin-specific chaperone cofactor E-like protein, partial [Fragariocoptes setiger]
GPLTPDLGNSSSGNTGTVTRNSNPNSNNNNNNGNNAANRCFRRRHVISATVLPAFSHNSTSGLNNTSSVSNAANNNLVKTGLAPLSPCGATKNLTTSRSTITTTTIVSDAMSVSTLAAATKTTAFATPTTAATLSTTGVQSNTSNSASNCGVSASATTTNNASATTTLSRDSSITQQHRSFIDCLVRRFKDCFSENFCSVPVYVVGNLSPGSDGTNLILPPCVILTNQNINRYASARYANIRFINSLRESCRNIEELDLGNNKLTELVEIYKILQVTPNLRFLNLSENDLSRATPMALASTPTAAHLQTSSSTSSTTASTSSRMASNRLSSPNQTTRRTQRAVSNVGQQQHGQHQFASPTSQNNTKQSRPNASTTPTLNGPSGKPTTGVKERRAARAVALSRSVSSLSAKDAKGLATSARSQRQQQQQQQAQRVPAATTASTTKPMLINQTRSATRSFVGQQRAHQQQHDDGDGDVVMTSSSSSTTTPTTTTSQHPSSATSSVSTNYNNYHNHHSAQSVYSRRTFESIRVLAMNNTHVSWRVVCSILTRMPNLEELHLSLNNYKSIDLEPSTFRHTQLRRLYLSGNPELSDWTELDKILAAFPSLEALSIADCNISNIPDNLDRARQWQKLCGLNICGWPIKEWPIIERLNQLPSLVDLKCQNVQVLNDIDEPRHHLIARLPKLVRLNGSEIEEREHAEKAFLRFFIQNQHLERPSRFHELIQVHGEVHPILDVDLSPPNKARIKVVYYHNKGDDEMLTPEHLLAVNHDRAEHDENDDIEQSQNHTIVPMTIDLRKTVKSFKIELSEIFGVHPSKMILYYIDHEMVGLMGPEMLKYNQKKLWNYNVQDGDQFIVDEK